MKGAKWRDLGARDKMQIVNGTALIVAAIILYFVCFIVTLTIGMGVISAGGTLLATGLAFFGITTYINNQMMNFEVKMQEKIKRLEEDKENEEQ